MNPNRDQLTREQLYEKVWSAPTTQVSAEMGISDVSPAKRCKKLNVPKPSLGYWAKVGKDSVELTAKCFHVIVANVESAGIPFVQPKGGRQGDVAV